MTQNEQELVDAVLLAAKPDSIQIAKNIIMDYLMQKESSPKQAVDLQPELCEIA